MLDKITGFLTSMNETMNITSPSSGMPAEAAGIFLAIMLAFFVWMIVFLLAYLTLGVISCFKQKLPFSDLLSRSFASFKALYKPMVRYYIPAIVLSAIIGVLVFILNLVWLFSPASETVTALAISLILAFVVILIVYSVYLGVLDSSLAKSYYASLSTKRFQFSWISFKEYLRLIGISMVYFLLLLASLLLLGIPLLFIPAISTFLRFPLLNEGKSIGASIRKLLSMLKANFWSIFFFYFIYSIIVGFASSLVQSLPVIGYIALAVLVTPFLTLLSAEAYHNLNKSYEKVLKKNS